MKTVSAQSAIIYLPIRCPYCKRTAEVPYTRLEIASLLYSPEPFRLYSTCHDVSWTATEEDRQALCTANESLHLATSTAAPRSADVIDWNVARRQTGGDEEILSEIVVLVKEECPRLLSDIRHAFATSNAELLQRSGHTLCNSAQYFGCQHISDLARQLELQGRAGDLRDASATVRSLEAEMSLFLQEIENYVP